jgi:PucR family transcriptional regulator, purine catabolism regulatory protein
VISSAGSGVAEITVAAALRLPQLQGGVPEVLAGAASLGNRIRWVHSGEWIEIASVLRGGELLLTTGMGLPADAAAQRRFIASLAERRIAGLVIELHTCIDHVPKDVVAEAEALGLPLVALHREIPFVEVTEALHREIVGRQALALERGEEAHRRFTELMLEGAGVAEVLEALAELIDNPVIVEKADEGVVFHQSHKVSDAAVRASWDAATRRLPQAPDHVSVPINLGRGRTWGTLAALALSSPLQEHDRVVLERGASVVALAMLRHGGEQELAARQRGDFIARLMAGAAGVDEREATAMAGDFGFDRRALLRLPLVAMRSHGWSSDANGDREAPWTVVWREVTRELQSMRISALTGLLPGEHGLGIVVTLRSQGAREELAGRVSSVVKRTAARVFGDERVMVCVGPVSRSWSELGAALHDAVEMSHAVGHAPARDWFDATGAEIDRLLWALRDEEALRTFVERRLDALVRHDREHRTQFVHTVETYCVHGGRVADTARSLHLRRQSLYKRLQRIEELIGGELSDPDVRLGLHFALRAGSYLEALDNGAE